MEGTVQKISSRQVNTQRGPATSYSLNVDGEWYSAGFQKPQCIEGDIVQFDVSVNGNYKNVTKNSLRVTGKGEAQPQKTQQPKKSGVEFRTPAQIMRTSALEQTIANATAPMSAEEIMLFADELYLYIDKGNSPIATDRMDSPPDDDIPF